MTLQFESLRRYDLSAGKYKLIFYVSALAARVTIRSSHVERDAVVALFQKNKIDVTLLYEGSDDPGELAKVIQAAASVVLQDKTLPPIEADLVARTRDAMSEFPG